MKITILDLANRKKPYFSSKPWGKDFSRPAEYTVCIDFADSANGSQSKTMPKRTYTPAFRNSVENYVVQHRNRHILTRISARTSLETAYSLFFSSSFSTSPISRSLSLSALVKSLWNITNPIGDIMAIPPIHIQTQKCPGKDETPEPL